MTSGQDVAVQGGKSGRQGKPGKADRAVVEARKRVGAAFARRIDPAEDLASRAGEVASAAYAMAVRFHHGGKLVTFGTGGASTDAQHVAVEFVHPVIVGKRALPAICLTSDAATMTAVAAADGLAGMFAHQIRWLAEPADIALGIAHGRACESVRAGLAAARGLGMLTIALLGAGTADDPVLADPVLADPVLADPVLADPVLADHVLAVASADPRVVKEIQVSTYHLLWELVHVFFEQPSVLGPGAIR